jgi:hypothetical protein
MAVFINAEVEDLKVNVGIGVGGVILGGTGREVLERGNHELHTDVLAAFRGFADTGEGITLFNEV